MSEISAEPRDEATGQVGHPTEQLEVQEPTQGEGEEIEYPTGLRFYLVFLAMSLTLFMIGLDSSILATAIPAITNQFHTISDVGWYVAAKGLTASAFQFMFGKLYTIYSSKMLFIVSVIIFEISSVICALAPTSTTLVIGRALAGLSNAGLISGLFNVMTHAVPLQRRALFGALIGAGEGIAQALGPVLGGTITDTLGWRFCFWINLPVGAITLFVFAFFYKTPQHAHTTEALNWKEKIQKCDLISTAFFVPSITCLLIAIQWGSSNYGWKSGPVLAMFVVFAVLLVPFVYMQRRQGEDATLPGRVIAQRSILAGMLFAACANGALTVVQYYMPIYNQTVLGVSAQTSGLYGLSLVVGLFVSFIFAGSMTTAVGFYAPFMLVGSVLSPIAAGLLTTLPMERHIAKILIYQFLLGFGCGIGLQAPQVAAQTVLAPRDVPLGTAAVMFAQGIGPTIVVSVAQALFQGRVQADIEHFAPALNLTTIEQTGLSDLKTRLGAKQLASALRGYNEAIDQTFYLPLALMCLSLVGSVAMEWRSVKKKSS